MQTCNQCGESSPSGAQFCIECGSSLQAATGATVRLPVKTCDGCGGQIPRDAQFCPICGRSFAATEAAAAQTAPPPLARPAGATQPRPGPASKPHASNVDYSPLILLGGLAVLFVLFRRMLFPGLLGLFGFFLLARHAAHGRMGRGVGWLVFLGGLAFLLISGKIWPGILLLLLASWLLGRVAHCWR